MNEAFAGIKNGKQNYLLEKVESTNEKLMKMKKINRNQKLKELDPILEEP